MKTKESLDRYKCRQQLFLDLLIFFKLHSKKDKDLIALIYGSHEKRRQLKSFEGEVLRVIVSFEIELTRAFSETTYLTGNRCSLPMCHVLFIYRQKNSMRRESEKLIE